MIAPHETSGLLREFIEKRSESAFAEVVRSHLNLVYSTALRRCHGDTATAEDIAQTVFADLARKAACLPRDVVLPAWLYRHTTFVASSVIRAETRRRQREQTAMDLQSLDDSIDWSAVAPVLDDAIRELPERDRDAIVLRFLDQQPFAQVGASLGISEDAARMRVDRALEKLRPLLARRGANSTLAALALALGQYATLAAPGGLAASIASTTLSTVTTTAVASSATSSLIGIMTSSKITIGVVSLIGIGAATTAFIEHQTNDRLRKDLAAAQIDLAATRTEVADAALVLAGRDRELAGMREQRVELMELRDKAARLRETEAALARLEQEHRNLKSAAAETDPAENPEAEPEVSPESETLRGLAIARMSYVKAWGLALHQFASENGGALPATLEEAAKHYPAEWNSLMSAFDSSRFEIVHRASFHDIPHPARTIIVREKEAFTTPMEDGTFTFARTYLFADGHSEIHGSPTGDFEAWERERMMTPPTP